MPMVIGPDTLADPGPDAITWPIPTTGAYSKPDIIADPESITDPIAGHIDSDIELNLDPDPVAAHIGTEFSHNALTQPGSHIRGAAAGDGGRGWAAKGVCADDDRPAFPMVWCEPDTLVYRPLGYKSPVRGRAWRVAKQRGGPDVAGRRRPPQLQRRSGCRW